MIAASLLPMSQAGIIPVDAGERVRPNILLICVDDLKPALGCYGDVLARTPNIDKLAGRALRLDRAFCNQAVCSPSRNALMTGFRPQTLGIYDLGTNFRESRPDAVTLAQHFRRHGYHTQALGKIFHVGHGNHEDDASWDVPHFRPKASQYAIPGNTPAADSGSDAKQKRADQAPKGTAFEAADVTDDTYADGQIANEAVGRLKAAASSGQPFFLAVGFLKPHLPFVAPQRYWDLHDPQRLPQPDRLTPPDGAPGFAPQFGGELRAYRGIPGGSAPLEPALTRQLIHGYYAAASYMDAQVGRILDALDDHGLTENTIVVLWGDHGWHLGDHGMWCKHTNYEQAARIPLLVAMPGRTGTSSAALVETVDVYPTLAKLAGLPAPDGVDGRSFDQLFTDPGAAHRDHAVHVYPRGNRLGRAIRTDRYRLVEWKEFDAPPETAEMELYDYLEDPGETRNLAVERADVVRQLRSLLEQHPDAKSPIRTASRAAESAKKTTGAAANQDRNAMFERRDADDDGHLSREEFLKNQPDPDEAPGRFLRFDSNRDGRLSREEFVNSGRVTDQEQN